MYEIFNNSKFLDRRKKLRKELTPQEYKLWGYLKNKNLGFKFRRQHGIGGYIVDFYCKEKNLIIEIDGSQHMAATEYDSNRDMYIQSLDIKVLRFWNDEINTNTEGVPMKIRLELE